MVEHRAGLPVARAVLGAPAARRADLVLALLERQGMLPGLLKRAHVPPYSRTPLVIWSCWLADDLRTAGPDERRRLVNRVRSADLVTHLSRHETEILVDAGLAEDRLFPVTYGVSHRYYTPGDDPRDLDLLAVGQDRGRDYATLVEAVRGTSLTLDVVCRPENLAGLDVPDNVRVHGPVPLTEYRALLRRAKVVAVPTRDLAYPTGSSVALESASSGAAVVVTGTRAMADYFVDGVERPARRRGRRRRLALGARRAARRSRAVGAPRRRSPRQRRRPLQRGPHVDRTRPRAPCAWNHSRGVRGAPG